MVKKAVILLHIDSLSSHVMLDVNARLFELDDADNKGFCLCGGGILFLHEFLVQAVPSSSLLGQDLVDLPSEIPHTFAI